MMQDTEPLKFITTDLLDDMISEVKEGPCTPRTAAEFAPWSPAEGTLEAIPFLDRMRRADIGTLPA